MSVAFEVPTLPQNRRMSIFLSGLQYQLVFRWNKFSSAWNLDIYDANNAPIALGLVLITGADLLEQLGYLGIEGQLIVQSDGSADTVPTFEGLGSTGHLYYRVSDAQAAEQVVSTQ